MYDNYESRAKLGRGAFLPRLPLALGFLATLGFAGGVLYRFEALKKARRSVPRRADRDGE